jgi:hypothetical protein
VRTANRSQGSQGSKGSVTDLQKNEARRFTQAGFSCNGRTFGKRLGSFDIFAAGKELQRIVRMTDGEFSIFRELRPYLSQ